MKTTARIGHLLRNLSVLLSLTLLFGFADAVEAKKLKVVTTLSDFASLAATIGGERVEAESIAKGYQDPHFVEPKPSFILKLHAADVLIVAGLELEIGYLPPLLDQARNEKIRPTGPGYLDASVGCEILERPTAAVTRAMGDVHPYGNPHYWLDPQNGRVVARAIAAKLAALDPAGADVFQKNLTAFEARLAEAEKRWQEKLGAVRGHEGRHVSRLVAELREVLQARRRGIPRAQARHPADAAAQARDRQPHAGAEGAAHPHGGLLRPEGPRLRGGQDGREVVMIPPSVGGEPAAKDYISLFDVDVEKIASALAKKK